MCFKMWILDDRCTRDDTLIIQKRHKFNSPRIGRMCLCTESYLPEEKSVTNGHDSVRPEMESLEMHGWLPLRSGRCITRL